MICAPAFLALEAVMRNHRNASEGFNAVSSAERSVDAIIATASIVSSSRSELAMFRDLIALGRQHIDGARSCIEQSIEALNRSKANDVPVAEQAWAERSTRAQNRPRLGSSTMHHIRLADIYRPETLKMIYEVFDELLRLTTTERTAVDASTEFAMRHQLGEILLTLQSEGESNPIMLRRRALEAFRKRQKRS